MGISDGPLWGGFSQFTRLPETNVVKLPDVTHLMMPLHCYGRIDFLAHVSG